MSLRPLIIDAKLEAQIAKVLGYAQAHPYIPGETIVPGDDPGYVLNVKHGYRMVFSFTRVPSGLYRDLSISVNSPGKYPHPFAAFTVATLYGFTGWDGQNPDPPPDWLIQKDLHWDAIRIVQQLLD